MAGDQFMGGELNIDTDFSEPFQSTSEEFANEGCQGGCLKNTDAAAEEDFGLNSTVFSNNNNNGDFN